MLKNVLVPLDGSTLAERALDYARQITEPGGTITLLTALDVPEYSVATFYTTGVIAEPQNALTRMDKLIPQARSYLESVAESLKDGGWYVRMEPIIGDAATVIVEQADKLAVEAIVMSTHGRSGFSRWLFGSVTQKVLECAHCPVFVVPIRKEAKEVQDA